MSPENRKTGAPVPRLLRVAEVAEALGLRVATVYAWVASRRLPVVRIGRSVRIPLDAISALVAENLVPAREEDGR